MYAYIYIYPYGYAGALGTWSESNRSKLLLKRPSENTCFRSVVFVITDRVWPDSQGIHCTYDTMHYNMLQIDYAQHLTSHRCVSWNLKANYVRCVMCSNMFRQKSRWFEIIAVNHNCTSYFMCMKINIVFLYALLFSSSNSSRHLRHVIRRLNEWVRRPCDYKEDKYFRLSMSTRAEQSRAEQSKTERSRTEQREGQ